MKIKLFVASVVAYLCLCVCHQNSNAQQNNQEFDPLTAPIEDVQSRQEKVKSKISDIEAPYDKKLKDILSKMENPDIGYDTKLREQLLKSYDQLALEKANATLGLRLLLPSDVLMDKFNGLLSKYANPAPLPPIYDLPTFTNDLKTINKIENILKVISNDDAVKVATQTQELQDAIHEDQIKKQELAAKTDQQKNQAQLETILAQMPKIKSERNRIQLSVQYHLNEKNEFVPAVLLQNIRFELTNSAKVFSNFVAFADWIRNSGPIDMGWAETNTEFTDDLGTTTFHWFNDGQKMQELKVVYQSDDGISETKFKFNDIQDLTNLFTTLPILSQKAEETLAEKKLAVEGNKFASP